MSELEKIMVLIGLVSSAKDAALRRLDHSGSGPFASPWIKRLDEIDAYLDQKRIELEGKS